LRCRNARGGKIHTAVYSARAGCRQLSLPARFFARMLRVNKFLQKLLAKSKAHH
jgi:hypothetical protein